MSQKDKSSAFPYKCPNTGCREQFKYRETKRRHTKKCEFDKPQPDPVHVIKTGEVYTCTVCSTIIKNQNNVSRHKRLCNSRLKKKETIKIYSCTFENCGKVFQYQSKLKEHSVVHNKPKFECSKCGKNFKRQYHHNNHESKCTEFTFTPSLASNLTDFASSMPHCSSTPDLNMLQAAYNIPLCENVLPLPATYSPVSPTTTYTSVLPDNSTLQSWDVIINGSDNFDESDNMAEKLLTPPRTKQYRRSKVRQRKYFSLTKMLEDVLVEDKEAVLSKALDDIFTPDAENTSAEPNNNPNCSHSSTLTEENASTFVSDVNFMSTFTSDVIKYFKEHMHNARKSEASKIEAAKAFCNIFGKRLLDEEYELFLVNLFGLQNIDDLINFTNYASPDYVSSTAKRGRKLISKEDRQHCYDFWISNSTVSVHRSNARHLVKRKTSNIKLQVSDLLDSNVRPSESNENKLEADRRITTQPYEQLHKIYQSVYDSTISFSSFYNLKPFYVSPPSVKEMESCLCITCLNIHCLYSAVRRNISKDMPFSLSEYLCSAMACDKDVNTSFPKFECATEKCESNCKIINIMDDLKEELKNKVVSEKLVNYYVFETVENFYYNTKGEKKVYSRTTRNDYKEPLITVVQKLEKVKKKYIKHRFFVNNDEYYWKNFLNNSMCYVLWMDYSQNLAFKEKMQAQSAHFSGKQQTLHNTLMIGPKNSSKTYIYHLSDDTSHDSIMTFRIIEDIIEKHPEIISRKKLILRTDNCPTQYKCKYVFHGMKSIAEKYNIEVVWFYGEPGHGKGLVDAMSSFGCKQPLRQAIVTQDCWFASAKPMVKFLEEHFIDDTTKEHYYIDQDELAQLRQLPREEHKLIPCMMFHLISVDSSGIFTKLLYYQDEERLLQLDFENVIGETLLSKYDTENDEDEDEDDNDETFTNNAIVENDFVYDCTTPGTYIGLRSPPNSLEQFFVAEVVNKCVATENMSDEYGHHIVEGERYLEVKYLQKHRESSKGIKYIQPKNTLIAYIHIEEVFITNVAVDENLKMGINEYQSILRDLFSFS